jgi:hypothetical protein
VVEHVLAKDEMGVRFSLAAPKQKAYPPRCLLLSKNEKINFINILSPFVRLKKVF